MTNVTRSGKIEGVHCDMDAGNGTGFMLETDNFLFLYQFGWNFKIKIVYLHLRIVGHDGVYIAIISSAINEVNEKPIACFKINRFVFHGWSLQSCVFPKYSEKLRWLPKYNIGSIKKYGNSSNIEYNLYISFGKYFATFRR